MHISQGNMDQKSQNTYPDPCFQRKQHPAPAVSVASSVIGTVVSSSPLLYNFCHVNQNFTLPHHSLWTPGSFLESWWIPSPFLKVLSIPGNGVSFLIVPSPFLLHSLHSQSIPSPFLIHSHWIQRLSHFLREREGEQVSLKTSRCNSFKATLYSEFIYSTII